MTRGVSADWRGNGEDHRENCTLATTPRPQNTGSWGRDCGGRWGLVSTRSVLVIASTLVQNHKVRTDCLAVRPPGRCTIQCKNTTQRGGSGYPAAVQAEGSRKATRLVGESRPAPWLRRMMKCATSLGSKAVNAFKADCSEAAGRR